MAAMVPYLILLACAAYISFVEGPSALALWNCAPMLLGALLVRSLRARRPASGSAAGAVTGLVVGSTALSLLVHLAFHLDLGRAASGSSTSALVFVVTP